MRFKDTGFRAFYHNFCAVPMYDDLKPVVEDYPGVDSANFILTYGFIDHEEGLTLEVLGMAEKNSEEEFSFFPTTNEYTAKIRIKKFEEDEFFYFDDEDGSLKERYGEKISALSEYDENKDHTATRNMLFLDLFRDEKKPDDINVFLIKEGFRPEGVQVRMEHVDENGINGTLLTEPEQELGVHIGDTVISYIAQDDKGNPMLLSDLK